MTTAEEHQIRHGFHAVDLGGRQQQTIRQHHAAAQLTVAVFAAKYTMGTDHQDPVRPGEQLVEHLHGTGAAAQTPGGIARAIQHAADRLAFAQRTGQPHQPLRPGSIALGPELFEIALGIRIANNAGIHQVRAHHLSAVALGDELAHQAGTLDHRYAVGLQHLPRQVGTAVIEHQNQVIRFAHGAFEAERQHQLEQAVAEERRRVVAGRVRPAQGTIDHALQQPRLTLIDHRLDPGALSHVQVVQALRRALESGLPPAPGIPAVADMIGTADLQARPVVAGRDDAQARPGTLTELHRLGHLQAAVQALEFAGQFVIQRRYRITGADRRIDKHFDNVQARHRRRAPLGPGANGRILAVGLEDAECHGANRFFHGQLCTGVGSQ
ncbi:hypothetical protein D3C76_516040 [compost metagenome]